MTWNRVYVVVWRFSDGSKLRERGPHLTLRGAERRVTRLRRDYPRGDYRVERIPLI